MAASSLGGVDGIDVLAVAEASPLLELPAQGLVVEREADDVDPDVDARGDQGRDRGRGVAAAGFFTIGDENDDLGARR